METLDRGIDGAALGIIGAAIDVKGGRCEEDAMPLEGSNKLLQGCLERGGNRRRRWRGKARKGARSAGAELGEEDLHVIGSAEGGIQEGAVGLREGLEVLFRDRVVGVPVRVEV